MFRDRAYLKPKEWFHYHYNGYRSKYINKTWLPDEMLKYYEITITDKNVCTVTKDVNDILTLSINNLQSMNNTTYKSLYPIISKSITEYLNNFQSTNEEWHNFYHGGYRWEDIDDKKY